MRFLQVTEVAEWVQDVLLHPQREKPVVAVTTRRPVGGTWIDPEALAETLGARAEVVCLETGEATWELAEALPPRLDVYGGAVRVWWPGLHRESDPYDHRLYIIHSTEGARSVFEELSRLAGGADLEPEGTPDALDVTVESVSGPRIQLVGEGCRGELRQADVPLEQLSRCLAPGTALRASPVRQLDDGRCEFSVRGLLSAPWDIAAEALHAGDVVQGRVQGTRPFGAFVEVLPGVTGLVRIGELDWHYVENVADTVRPGQLVNVRVLNLDEEERRLQLSVKHAFGVEPRPLPSLVPGGEPFYWPGEGDSGGDGATAQALEDRIRCLTDELDAAVADRAQLAEANKELRQQVQELKKQLRASEDRLAGIERKRAHELDPLRSERAFLLAVRLAYARLFDEGTRFVSPLHKMRVGGSFLRTLRSLEGVDCQKVLEVCAQVAADAAHELASREVHQLRAGPAGSGARIRASDQAQTWRCALQVKTPSARRLHWWRVPGTDGPMIEFASVGLHDDFSIPE